MPLGYGASVNERDAQFEIGAAKVDFGAPKLGVGMMGWAMPKNIVGGSATPLHARALVFGQGEARAAIVVCELAFISISIKQGVCDRLAEGHPELGLHEGNLMMSATHTHSGPGGYTHYHFYNLTIPGFVPEVLAWAVDGIVKAIVQAAASLTPGRLRFLEGEFDESLPVAFNRSVESYNLNADTESLPLDANTRALDRTMRLLSCEDMQGRPIASVNWFAVHCTSIHSDNQLVHFDNKGYAAQLLESALAGKGGADYVGAFAQGAAGDVTPNYRVHDEKPWVRGSSVDDDESARDNGQMQSDKAQELVGQEVAVLLTGPLQWVHTYVDFSQVDVDPRFSDGQSGRRTGPAEIGWAMLFGTEEGPGIPRRLLFTQAVAQKLRAKVLRARPESREVQGDKVTVVETGRRRIMGIEKLRRLPKIADFHPALAQLRALDQSSRVDAKPWTPQILPLQILRIGSVAIISVPAEFTTVAGRRLRATVQASLAEQGVEHVVLAGYANAYAGYVTTHEEYALQDYEGASTHFGRWTLGAYQTRYELLARRLGQKAGRDYGPRPPRFGDNDLDGRVYREPKRLGADV